jgi:predicted ATPase
VQLTPFLGREAEVATLFQQLLREDIRLLTLTGPGGTGKTRLAVQVAAQAIDRFADGVYFVDLAPLSDPTLVSTVIAQVLHVRQGAGRPLIDVLKDSLRSKNLLLVLDNYEHLLEGASTATELLAASTGLKILATSRAPLHLHGEHEFPVPPLGLPEQQVVPSIASLSQCDAVRLFIDRAQAVQPAFSLNDANARSVAEICHRLEGLPLAIELAAARTRHLAPERLLSRLERRLPLLTGGPRDIPARQQTLRDTIAWSHELLGEPERAVFRRLAVFAGGCTLEAAEAICGADALDGMSTLLDQSLLQERQQALGQERFTMLETIREFASEQLEASGEADAVRRRHVEYYLSLVEGMWPVVGRTEMLSTESFRLLEQERGNLRLALAWAPQLAADLEAGPRLAGSLGMFWYQLGHFSEGQRWTERMLNEPVSPAVRARLLGAAALSAFYQDDFGPAANYWEGCLAIYQELGNQQGVAATLYRIGLLKYQVGDYETAVSLCAKSVDMWRNLWDKSGLAGALMTSAIVAKNIGDSERAVEIGRELVPLVRELSNRAQLAYALRVVAGAASDLADDEVAQAMGSEALKLFRDLGDPWGLAMALGEQMRVAQRRGESIRVMELCHESLLLFRDVGARMPLAVCYETLAWVAANRVEFEKAARFLGAAEALRESIGAPIEPRRRAEHDRLVAEVRAKLKDETLAAAWARGREMLSDEVFAYALECSVPT